MEALDAVNFDVRAGATGTPAGDAPPAEIFLDTEQATNRRLRLKQFGNVHTIPRLRSIGFTLLALVGVPLHNTLITHNFQFDQFIIFLIAVEVYCAGSWAVLRAFYKPTKGADLGDVFLYADLVVVAGAVYVTGGDRSWFFWLPLMRVFDQSVHGFKRSMGFVLASIAIFVGLWLYLQFVEDRNIDLNAQFAKTVFVAISGFYIALTSRALERVRAKLVSTVRFARQAMGQLKDNGEALKAARARAESASQAKSEFLARVSHELRRPATTVIGFAQLLEIGELSAKQRDYATRILRSGHDLGVLLDEVMDLADLQSGLVTMAPSDVPLPNIVEESLAQLWPLAAARGVQLVHDDKEFRESLRVWADPRALRRVILNTVAHALRYSAPDDRVVISWKRNGNFARISVRDSGTGVLSSPVEEVLSAASTIEEDIVRMQQLGLGLAFAKALVLAMNGHISADLELGEGTTYMVDIPLTSAVTHSAATSDAMARH